MNDTLFPTPVRLALLRDVAAGNVTHNHSNDDAYLTRPGEQPYKVTARIAEVEAADWVVLPRLGETWTITPAGRHELDRAVTP
jgi:hypothetical protein